MGLHQRPRAIWCLTYYLQGYDIQHLTPDVLLPISPNSYLAFIIGIIQVANSLVAQLVKNQPAMQKTLVQFLGQEGYPCLYSWVSMVTQSRIRLQCKRPGSIPDLGRFPGEGIATHSSILAWTIPCTEEPGRLQSMRWQRVGHD